MLEALYLTKSAIRRKLLGFLFSNPKKQYYLSELARLAHTSPGNVQRELAKFIQDGLVHKEKKGSLVFFALNPGHALFPELKSLVLKTAGIEAELKTLVARHKEIKLAILYGSFAKRKEHGESDIDLLMVVDGDTSHFYSEVSRFELLFSRDINPTVYSSHEFRRKLKEGGGFITDILEGEHRILKGDLSEYQKKNP